MFFVFIKTWIVISAWASLAGWVLSSVGQLNVKGYLVFGVVSAVIFWWFRGSVDLQIMLRGSEWRKLGHRIRRPFPAAFALFVFLIFVGGILYEPSNHTGLSYRLPRVLHWLANGGWEWIHTPNYRMNNRACGIEWLTAPILLFTKSDRGIFLLNFVPFLLMPGIIFSVCTQLGVKRAVAWVWMWLLPTGYNFLLQAGSAGNDTFPAVYALAAVDFGCRAWNSRRVGDILFSTVAAALLVGAKASNLPLLLPWAVLVIPLWRLLPRRPVLVFVVGIIALAVSFLPTAILNIYYCGDWSGLNLERTGMNMKNPIVGVWGNALIFLLNNFAFPFIPVASWWNQNALKILPHFIVVPMVNNFEEGFHLLGEIPTEDWAGLGFGLSILALLSLAACCFRQGVDSSEKRTLPWISEMKTAIPTWVRFLAIICPWIALMAYCMKSGMVTGARLISPYYPLLLPLLIISSRQVAIVRSRWWQAVAWAGLILAVPVLLFTPGRPLWPAQTVLSRLSASHPNSHAIARSRDVYAVYAHRSDPLANVREMLPAEAKVIGFIATEDDIDISLWRPFGSRIVKDVLLDESVGQIRQRGIRYVVVGGFNLQYHQQTLAEWQARTGAELLANAKATLKVSEGPQPWYVLRIPD